MGKKPGELIIHLYSTLVALIVRHPPTILSYFPSGVRELMHRTPILHNRPFPPPPTPIGKGKYFYNTGRWIRLYDNYKSVKNNMYKLYIYIVIRYPYNYIYIYIAKITSCSIYCTIHTNQILRTRVEPFHYSHGYLLMGLMHIS